MKKRNKIIAKALMFLTVIAPVPIYLFIMASFFNVKPDYTINNVDISDLNVFVVEGEYFVSSNDTNAIYNGIVSYNADLNTYTLVISEDDVIRVGKKLYHVKTDLKDENDELLPLGLYEVNVKKIKKEQRTTYNWSIIGMVAAVIVALIIIKRMQLEKQYPRIAVMIALVLGTAILYGINKIVADMLYVFVVASVSWAIYLIEYTTYFYKLSAHEKAALIAKLEKR